MLSYLFSAAGRVNRAQYWGSVLIWLVALAIVGVIVLGLWQVVPGELRPDGTYTVEGARAVPYLLVGFAYFIAATWSGICLGIKRFHDRDKSGWWILIQFVPIIGAIWFLVEAGFLRGTIGPNRYGLAP